MVVLLHYAGDSGAGALSGEQQPPFKTSTGLTTLKDVLCSHVCIYVMYIYIYLFIYICIYVHINIYIYMYVFVFIYIHIYIYIYIRRLPGQYTCIYIYIHIYIYIYTYNRGGQLIQVKLFRREDAEYANTFTR